MQCPKCGTEFRISVVFDGQETAKVKRVNTMSAEDRKAIGVRLQPQPLRLCRPVRFAEARASRRSPPCERRSTSRSRRSTSRARSHSRSPPARCVIDAASTMSSSASRPITISLSAG